ncbi:thioesterase family protein [Mycolicibacterium fluoranthenivorans]|uniref:Thioesterase family protein n=1 Tax=Mycolicibacterium fluoranthenivorans TaxID=258505 RepID=A0A7G8PPB8_9MYCO|nr:thioesterase family protein [Mycolicibacterium fluoranthenivorans]QNJ96184.1 thioesterase family protein [Mycolicibacterium fluoranthenivorans]
MTPFVVHHDGGFVPSEIAQGNWGPTLGGQVVGGLLARAVERMVEDPQLQPARLTVEILRRVATKALSVEATVTRTGRRMRAVSAVMTQDGQLVARASSLYLRRGHQPDGPFWSTPLSMPPIPDSDERVDERLPMFICAYGSNPDPTAGGHPWAHDGPRYAWIRETRDLVGGEALTPFVRAAMAADVTSSMTNFNRAGLSFINADFTLTLSRLPDGPFLGLAALTHYSDAGVATGTATVLDHRGPIGSNISTAIANYDFANGKFKVDL